MKYLMSILAGLVLFGRLDAQCPAIANCPATPVEACDLTPNDPTLWNEPYWTDPFVSTHDLADASVDLSITATDACVGGLQIRFELFLDLDNNGTQETVIDSDSLAALASGTVPFGNYPGGGGTVRTFDERAVAAADKFRFALEETGTGSDKTARVRWATTANPGAYIDPQLPYGTHKIKWYVLNGLQDQAVCEYPFIVKDCKNPTVVCLNGLPINIMPTGLIQLWATDFLQYMEDNHTPTTQLQLGIRKAGAGTGFPLNPDGTPQQSVLYDCTELGTQLVEVWSKDASGNADYCQTYAVVQDNAGFCAGNGATVDMHICINHWCSGAPVTGVKISIQGYAPAIPPINLAFFGDTAQYDSNGCLFFGPSNAIPLLSNFVLTPVKEDDPLNGVSVLDLIRINKHILGLEPLGSAYAIIAADANNSRSITTFDVIEHRKLLTGIYEEYPNAPSWRFVDGDYIFPNPNNPFQSIFPETKQLSNILDTVLADNLFYGIKIGDVDCSAIPGLAPEPEDRQVSALTLTDRTLQAGETVEVPVYAAEAGAWLGFQLGLLYDAGRLEVVDVLPGALPDWDAYTVGRPQPGVLNIVWFDTQAANIHPDHPLFVLRVRARSAVRLAQALNSTRARLHAEAVTAGSETRNLMLNFINESDDAASIGQPQPNPTANGAMIALQLADAATVQASIFDAQGRLLWYNETARETGVQQLVLPDEAFPDTGVYFWKVQVGSTRAEGKLVVLRK